MSENRKQLFAFVGPFAVFMVMTWLEGRPELKPHYPFVYPAKIALVCIVLFAGRKLWPPFASRGLLLGVLVGAVGLPVWVLLAKVDLLSLLPEPIGGWIAGSRSGLDPTEFDGPTLGAIITVRLLGLALVVPLMEELFWRGFLMRFFIAEPFQKVPIGTYTRSSFIIVTLAFVAAHPEIVAALVWGAAINVLLYRTKNLWACMAMHATTNALLGAYILATGSWHLW